MSYVVIPRFDVGHVLKFYLYARYFVYPIHRKKKKKLNDNGDERTYLNKI